MQYDSRVITVAEELYFVFPGITSYQERWCIVDESTAVTSSAKYASTQSKEQFESLVKISVFNFIAKYWLFSFFYLSLVGLFMMLCYFFIMRKVKEIFY